ncbi:MAG: hypothetical protein ACK559_23350, partial [bacterium]
MDVAVLELDGPDGIGVALRKNSLDDRPLGPEHAVGQVGRVLALVRDPLRPPRVDHRRGVNGANAGRGRATKSQTNDAHLVHPRPARREDARGVGPRGEALTRRDRDREARGNRGHELRPGLHGDDVPAGVPLCHRVEPAAVALAAAA